MQPVILIVEDLRSIRMAICDILRPSYQVVDVENAEQAEDILAEQAIDFLLTDIHLPGKSGTELIENCQNTYPELKYAMFTAYDVNQYIHFAYQKKISQILPKYSFLDIQFIKSMVDKLVTKDIFGVEKYLKNIEIVGNCERPDQFCPPQEGQIVFSQISSDKLRVELCEKIGAYLVSRGAPTVINQVLEELSSNAMIRAPRDDNGYAKYQYEFPSKDIVIPLKNIRFESADAFEIGYGWQGDIFAIITRDKFGSLKKEEILKRFDRHIHLDKATGLPLGLADSHGRGLFICREISDSLIFNIEKGVKTEILCFLKKNGNRFHKTLSIFEQ